MPSIESSLSQAIALHRSGRFSEAESLYRGILDRAPGHPDALHLIGVVAHQTGDHARAVDLIGQAIGIHPLEPSYHNNLGEAHRALGQPQEAEPRYRRALELNPDYADALSNLGAALEELGRSAEAEGLLRRAIELKPGFVDAHNNLGNVLLALGDPDQAIHNYRRAIALDPTYFRAFYNLGSVLCDRDEFDEAAALCRTAAALHPGYAEAHNMLGNIALRRSRTREAAAHYERAIGLAPDNADYHTNLALVLLLEGNFARGWEEYRWRRRTRRFSRRDYDQPIWDGAPPDGRTILVYAEQGLGDTIQFVRFASQLGRQGARVIVECQKQLVELLRTCDGIDTVVARGEPLPEFDAHLPLLDLPGRLGTRFDTIPAQKRYLAADPRRIADWRERLGALPGFRIGISWQGNSKFPYDRHRSVPLDLFLPLADIPGVRLVSLQHGEGTDQVESAGVSRWLAAFPDLDATGPFADTAAIAAQLDLVVASDSAVAHLAGALGTEVWLAVSAAPDWRWLLERATSPWYPSMTLFRQQQLGRWKGVFQRMAAALAERLRGGESV